MYFIDLQESPSSFRESQDHMREKARKNVLEQNDGKSFNEVAKITGNGAENSSRVKIDIYTSEDDSSSDFVNKEGQYPSEKECNQGHIASYKPTSSPNQTKEKDKQESLNGQDSKDVSNIPPYPNNILPNPGKILPYPNNPTPTSDNLYPNKNPSYPTDIPSCYDFTAGMSDNDATSGRVEKCQRVRVIVHTPNFQHEEQTNTPPQSDQASSIL